MKYFPLIMLAIFLDGIQGGLAFAFLGAGQAIGVSIGWIPVIDQIAASAATGAGTAVSVAVSFCLSATFGSALIIFMLHSKLFYPKLLIFGGIELIPVVNIVPGWTGFVFTSIMQKNAEEKRKGVISSEDSEGETSDSQEEREEESGEFVGEQESRVSSLRGDNDNMDETLRQTPARAPFLPSRHIDGIRSPQTMPPIRANNDNLMQEKHAA